MTPELDQAIRDFAARHPEYGTPEGAHDRCREASGRFCGMLRERGIHAGVDEIAVVDGMAHKAVEVGPWLVDWTARQFNQEAEWPLLLPNTCSQEDVATALARPVAARLP